METAIISVMIAAIGLAFTFYRYYKDRPELRIELMVRDSSVQTPASQKPTLVIEGVNQVRIPSIGRKLASTTQITSTLRSTAVEIASHLQSWKLMVVPTKPVSIWQT